MSHLFWIFHPTLLSTNYTIPILKLKVLVLWPLRRLDWCWLRSQQNTVYLDSLCYTVSCCVYSLLSLCLVGRWWTPSAPRSYCCSPKPLQSNTPSHHTDRPLAVGSLLTQLWFTAGAQGLVPSIRSSQLHLKSKQRLEKQYTLTFFYFQDAFFEYYLQKLAFAGIVSIPAVHRLNNNYVPTALQWTWVKRHTLINFVSQFPA